MHIIIGAGIGGLTAAIACRRAGLDYAVFERTPELAPVGAGISLWRNALYVFDQLGVGDAVRRLGAPNNDAGLRTWDGRMLTPAAGLGPDVKLHELAVVVPRAALHELLFEAADPARVTLGRSCTRFTDSAAGVTVEFADGTRAQGDTLIGADGLHSIVRAALHGDAKPVYAGYTAWRSVVRFDHARILPGESWGAGQRFGAVAMGSDLVYWFATLNAPEGERAPAGSEKALLGELFGRWHAPIPALIEASTDGAILRNDIYDRPPLADWGRGRVTLLGDAAHPMTPNLGQGACQAVEDALVLARHLRAASAADVPAALRAYERERRPRVEEIVKVSRMAGAIGQWTQPAAIWLRNTLMRVAGVPLQRRQLARVIGVEV